MKRGSIEQNNSNPIYRLEPFFDLSPDLLCIAGYDGYFKRINPSVSNTLGYTEAELLARPIHEFMHDDDRELTLRHRTQLYETPNPLAYFENRYITKEGDVVWLSWTSMPLREEKLIYAIAKNITHKKILEESRNILLSNLTKVNTELQHLNYSTSHNLRSPVNNMLSIFNLMDMSKIQDERSQKFLSMMRIATEGLKDTLNNFVDAIKQRDGLHTDIEEVDLKESLDVVRQSIHNLLVNARAKFEVDFSEIGSLVFSKAYLESIFLNLITNSVKYAIPEKSPVISIKSTRVQGGVQITYSDNGLGFDMEKVKDRIFGMHQTFHDNKESKGIGLYLVYNHIKNFGGDISVDSRVNEGTTFTIFLPHPSTGSG